QQRIETQCVMIVQILVAQGQTVNALGDQVIRCMFDQLRVAMVGEALGESPNEPHSLFKFAKKHGSAVRSDGSAVKISDDVPSPEGLELQRYSVTLCHCPWPFCWSASLVISLDATNRRVRALRVAQ